MNKVFTTEGIHEQIFWWKIHIKKQINAEHRVLRRIIKIMKYRNMCTKFDLCYNCYNPLCLEMSNSFKNSFSEYINNNSIGYCSQCVRLIDNDFKWLKGLHIKINLNRVKIMNAIKNKH